MNNNEIQQCPNCSTTTMTSESDDMITCYCGSEWWPTERGWIMAYKGRRKK